MPESLDARLSQAEKATGMNRTQIILRSLEHYLSRDDGLLEDMRTAVHEVELMLHDSSKCPKTSQIAIPHVPGR